MIEGTIIVLYGVVLFIMLGTLVATCLLPSVRDIPSTASGWHRAWGLFRKYRGPAVVISLCGITIIPLSDLLAANYLIMRRAKIAETKITMDRVDTAFHNYLIEYDDHLPPAKDPAGLIENFIEDNPRKIAFLNLKPSDRNARGEALDAWGTPLHITVVDAHHLEILSAGPDRSWRTPDDLALK